MQPWRWKVLAGCGVLFLAIWSAEVRAQIPSTAGMGTSDGSPPGYRTNTFANPHFNPFMNPYAAQGQVSRDELMLYFLAARQAQAAQGQGSTQGQGQGQGQGQFSGIGRRASARTPAPSRPQTAEMPYRSMAPGGTAGSYFQRQSTSKPGARGLYGEYYGRYGRHFDHNGR